MNIDTAYPSKFLKASDLPEEGQTAFKIEEVRVEEIGRDKQKKPVIYFEDEDKGFVCNVTNKNIIKKVLGTAETDEWVGKTVRLYRAEVEFGGDIVESIRVSAKPGGSKQAAPPADNDDEIPF